QVISLVSYISRGSSKSEPLFVRGNTCFCQIHLREDFFMRKLTGVHEECGVFGIYDMDGENVASSIYYGLSALQHRGQEACGIAVSDTEGPREVIYRKGPGLVSEVFKEENLKKLHGNIGVGHVRYSTTGASTPENAQPLVLNYAKGTLTLAHNGNLVNTAVLREKFENEGTIFQTTTDFEIIAQCIAKVRVCTSTVDEAIFRTVRLIKGAYGLVIMSPRKLVAVRDPYGLIPLCLGKRGNSFIVVSESCALS